MRFACIVPHIPPHIQQTQNAPQNKTQTLRRLAESCFRFSPMIAVAEDCVFVEIGKCARIYTEQSFMLRAQVLLKKLNISARIGIAHTLPHAKAEALFGKNLPTESLQIFANPYKNEKGLHEAIQTLVLLGIHNLNQLQDIPKQEIPARLGKEATLALHMLENAVHIPFHSFQPSELITETETFHPDQSIAETDTLTFVIKKLLDLIFVRLHGQTKNLSKLQIEIEQEHSSIQNQNTRQYSIEFSFPQSSSLGILPQIREQIDHDLQKNPFHLPVIQITCTAEDTVPSRNRQQDFFSKREQQEQEVNQILSRLMDRLGEDKVFYALPVQSYIPERSWRKSLQLELFQGETLGVRTSNPPLSKRPLRLIRNPIPLRRIENIFQSKKKRWKAVHIQGPERIRGEWWLNDTERDYFKIQTHQNEWIWVYRTPDQQYFLHGIFD